jgi:hypothetical protein
MYSHKDLGIIEAAGDSTDEQPTSWAKAVESGASLQQMVSNIGCT